jgi:hypothetical protein
MFSTAGEDPFLKRRSSSEISAPSRWLTGRTHSPACGPPMSLPAMQRPEYFRELARQTISQKYAGAFILPQARP